MRKKITMIMLFWLVLVTSQIVAQADRTVYFDVESSGISKTIEFGPDLAWANEQAFRRVILFMGLDQVDIVRASFQPTYPLVNGTGLTNEQLEDLNFRLWLIDTYVGSNTNLALNCDHPWVDEWYIGEPERWEQLIEETAKAFEARGHNVITVGAFNEPDYGWGQYTDYMDMYYITELLNNNSYFNGVRLSGGNTLNCDEAQGWYDFLVPAGVTEGNTHQLAGSFDGFASFYQNVRANGHHATGDELHNLVEALVGYEYGMQTGIWWADIDYASGELVKAMDGERLGYAEHRDNWTAAAVYRAPDGKVQAFMGGSERQAFTTTYKFVSQNKPVFFDGNGPYYEYTMEYPGGTDYWNGQSNAERVINITWGEDIQPVIDGSYIIVNRSNGLAMQVDGTGRKDGENVVTGSYSALSMQKWNVYPVDPKVGGDFSYFRFNPVTSSRYSLDLNGYNLDDGANIDIWLTGEYGNHQWYLDYAEDGYFYIRSRESSKCLDLNNNNVVQNTKNGNYSQQWRLIPVGSPIEFDVPNAPSNLSGIGNESSIGLSWTASSSSDVAGYTIFRKELGGEFNTIARKVTTTTYEDFDVQVGIQYYYKIDAIDASLNRSSQTSVVGPLELGSGGSGCDPTQITAYYQVNGGAWTIGTDITIVSGDIVTFGPQPLEGGSWTWTGCGTSGTSREQTVTLTSSCSATATYLNDCGAESSITYNVTVTYDPSFMLVQSIATGKAKASGPNYYGTAEVIIVDGSFSPVSGATVFGTFSGTFNESVSGVTGADGKVTFQTSASAKLPTIDFCVDDVTHSSLIYDPALNYITCTGSQLKGAATSSATESVELLKEAGSINIETYPNPVESVLSIAIKNYSGQVMVEIYKLDGKLEKKVKEEVNTNGKIEIPTWGYSGLALVKVKAGSDIKIFKIQFLSR